MNIKWNSSLINKQTIKYSQLRKSENIDCNQFFFELKKKKENHKTFER